MYCEDCKYCHYVDTLITEEYEYETILHCDKDRFEVYSENGCELFEKAVNPNGEEAVC